MRTRRLPDGAGYETTDGQFRIVGGSIPETCDNPHPGCPGGQFHDRQGWLVLERSQCGGYGQITWERPFASTKREAVDLIAWHIAQTKN